jgi:GT2 family glycosyltransferase
MVISAPQSSDHADSLFRELLIKNISERAYDEPIMFLGEDAESCSDIVTSRGYHRTEILNLNSISEEAVRLELQGKREATYGCIVLKRSLGCFEEPRAVVREIHRLLEPGGLFFSNTPFYSELNPRNREYFRFTPNGIRKLLEQFQDVSLVTAGEENRPVAIFSVARKPGTIPVTTTPVDIVMLTYNRLKYLQQTVDALFERTRYPFRLTVIDNASKADVRDYLEKNRRKFYQLILNDKNEYVPAFHDAIVRTTSDIFVATEPDIVVPDLSPCWLTQYMEMFQENSKLGLLGMRLDPKDRSPMTPSWSGGVNSAPVYNRRILQGNIGVWMMAIRRRVYPGSFFSECSVCDAVRKKGYVVGYTKDIFATHLGWYEYRDYPEYLLEKSKRPHPCFPVYEEAKLIDLEKLQNKKKPTMVVTTFNGRLAWLKDLLESIKAFTAMPFEFIIVDNGTTDDTGEFLTTLDWVRTIRNEKNLDDTIGVNQALKIATTDYIVKVDTDTLIAGQGWWEAIYEFMEEHPNVGIAGDVWNPRFEVESKLYKPGWTPRNHGIERLAHVQGGFMVLRKEMLAQIGFFNEVYPHDCMDVELSYRALSYGWELGHLDFVKAQILKEPQYSSEYKVYHPVRTSALRTTIMKRVCDLNLESKECIDEIVLVQNGTCKPHISPSGKCEIISDSVFISGTGWDNCMVSEQPLRDCVFSVGVQNLRGSAILKIRLQDKNNPASNSYHVILGDWGNYVAKACHVFKKLILPTRVPLQIKIAAMGSMITVFLNEGMVAQFHDNDLEQGHVAFGVKDGHANFLRPRIQYY